MAKRVRADSSSTEPTSGDSEQRDSGRSPSVGTDAHTPKYASLDLPEVQESTMRCHLPPHKTLSFQTYDDYETHYLQAHTNRCNECGKNFPTAHFLELHIAENHDPIVASKKDAGEKTYACFVEGCDKVCSEWKKRRSHLVDKHGFPKNYDFLVVDNGIDHRRSMLRAGVDEDGHRKSSRERGPSNSSVTEATSTTEAPSTSETTNLHEDIGPERVNTAATLTASTSGGSNAGTKAEMDDLTSSFSSLKMVPRSVTFGRRKGRSGLAKS